MVKEATVSVEVLDYSAQQLYDLIYATDAVIKRFHLEVNHQPATVSPWVDHSRTVSFIMALNVPAMLKSVIGVDAVEVEDVQTLTWQDGKHGFYVESQPVLKMTGANQFKTSGSTLVSETAWGSCKVECTLSCSANMPWPMRSSVEAVMAQQAVVSIQQFLDFCLDACQAARAQQLQPPPSPALPEPAALPAVLAPAAAAAAVATAAANGAVVAPTSVAFVDGVRPAGLDGAAESSFFYDADDAFSEFGAGHSGRSAEAILTCLRSLEQHGASGVKTLHALEALLVRIDGTMTAALREGGGAAAAGASRSRPEVSGTKAAVASAPPAAASSAAWLLALGVGFAAGSVITLFVCSRTSRQAS